MGDLVAEVPDIFLDRSQRDQISPLLSKEYKPEGYDHALVALASLDNFIYLIRASADESEKALSWRDFRVGAAVLAYNFENPAIGIMVGANVKPAENGGLNLHAEQIALAKARRYGLDKVFAIAVWGDHTDEDANPSLAPTLRPCSRCEGMFAAAPEVSERTLILSGNDDLSNCELYTAQQLHDYYAQDSPKGPVSDIPLYSLADSADEDAYIIDIFAPHLLPLIARLYPDSEVARFFSN